MLRAVFDTLPQDSDAVRRIRSMAAPPRRRGTPPPRSAAPARDTTPGYRGYLHLADVGDTYTSQEAATLLQLENAVLKRRLFAEPAPPLTPTGHEEEDLAAAPRRVADHFARADAAAQLGDDAPRHLVVVGVYPTLENPYGNGFVHRRVKYFQAAGVRVDVAVIDRSAEPRSYEYDGVHVLVGRGAEAAELLRTRHYESVAAHFLVRSLWEPIQDALAGHRFFAFMHGFESRRWIRTMRNHRTQGQVDDSIVDTLERQRFWREVLDHPHGPERFVFVSRWWRRAAQEDMELVFPAQRTAIVHNVIDTDLFCFVPKDPEQRFRVLWVRSAANLNYGADLAVRALERLRDTPLWDRMQVTVIGDGKHFGLFEEAFADDANVTVERRFAVQEEIAALHREHGVFLVPTRLDSQGVSRDEAMASGLVPVTNDAGAVREFVDKDCAMIADAEDVAGLADGLRRLMEDPDLFLRMSRAAAARVRAQTSPEHTVDQEMALMGLAAGPGGRGEENA
ncbi:glycosyl transferase [Micrococcus luteus]|uniref:Glycosyltransferase n=3 Tax=Micrococcus luteus TaxID=1270 RepID=C5CAF5_MICLC|nr:glycosyltransferase [Micrococcus luteus NCTC 2665]AJO55526.1 glycosyl transferase [Micrococcus luteus]ORE61390.1 glycosyl transferase [Micrococcus luteus]RFP71849.1 glycosyltransferase [Micrococcus luteus]SQG49378.1 N-acetyl-alpha-D-glucosaminyl L-malate synthase BshA [Micrococcus luteus NCTC 2665]